MTALNFEYSKINIIKKLLHRPKSRKIPIDPKNIVSRGKHGLVKQHINPNATTVVKRLTDAGYEAYLVGGCVRDLLIQRSPKDFDVSTNATPQQIKKLFRQARIIGRRFKLVHIPFHREIIEVATFRAHEPVHSNFQTNDRGMLIEDNVYGSLEQDAWRRDFSINSLYYHVSDESIVDFTRGFEDIQQKLIRIIGDPITRYHEDPVRMLRAIRFSAKLQFDIVPETAAPIQELSHLIAHVSSSRLFDEIIKLYHCGQASAVQPLLEQYGLFQELFPFTAALNESPYPVHELLRLALESTDHRIHIKKPVNPAFLFAILLWFPVQMRTKLLCDAGADPMPAFEQAISQVLSEQNKIITIPKKLTQIIREIWLLQLNFEKRSGHQAYDLLHHSRFRAAYDFLALRALAEDESLDLAKWWTTFQEVDAEKQHAMVKACNSKVRTSKRPTE
ncbi:MAG: polynucleotide adenylyltransferase PcnB [Gammaproteobacteria bacterium]|nr:polynucleotide adenylyltransferase PcnB [Gammaproteobacteria bacterium]